MRFCRHLPTLVTCFLFNLGVIPHFCHRYHAHLEPRYCAAVAAWRALLCLLAPLLIVYLLELRVRRAWLLQRQEREQLPSLCSTAGMSAVALPSAAHGMATARSTQRPTATGFHSAAGGGSQLSPVAKRSGTRTAVAAAGSGIGASIQVAAAQANLAAWQLHPYLVAAFESPAQQMLGVVAVAFSALAAVKVLHNLSKQQFKDLCQYDQPAAVMTKLCRTLREVNRRFAISLAFIAAALIMQHVLFAAASEWLKAAVELCIECMAFPDAAKAIWVFCIAKHGKASSSDQQPSMP